MGLAAGEGLCVLYYNLMLLVINCYMLVSVRVTGRFLMFSWRCVLQLHAVDSTVSGRQPEAVLR